MRSGREKKSFWARDWAIALCVLVPFCLLLVMPYLSGHWRLADDAYANAGGCYSFQERVLKQEHEWPRWFLSSGLGQPTALVVGCSWFYPPQVAWGLTVGWSELSYVYYLALHLMVGGWLAWLLCRRLGLSQEAGLFGAMAYVGNGYVMGSFSNFNLAIPYLLYPLVPLGLLDIHRKRLWRGVFELEIGAFALEVASYPLLRILFVLCTGLGYWAMAREKGSWFKGLRWKAIALALGVAVVWSAPEWMSTLRAVPLADRLGHDIYDEVTYNSPTSFLSLATALLPNLFLRRDVHELGVLWLERSWWVGSLTLFLPWLALRRRVLSTGWLGIPLGIGLVMFLFALGGHSFVREMLSELVPPLSHLRHAVYLRCVPMGLLAFLGALALDQLRKKPPAKPRSDFVAQGWVLFVGAIVLVAISESDKIFNVTADNLYADPTVGWKIALLHSSFYLLLAYTAYARGKTLLAGWSWPVAILAIQFVSMADAAYAFRRVNAHEEPLRPMYDEPFQVQSPHPNERSMHRAYSMDDWNKSGDWFEFYGNKVALFAYNTPNHRDFSPAMNDPRTRPLLGQLVSCQGGDALPQGRDPGGLSCQGLGFRIDRYYGNVIEISGLGPSSAVIVAHDLYDPHWTAKVNGQPAEVLPAFGYFKGVRVPAGPWSVRFEYVDPLFPGLWFVGLTGLLLVVFGPRLVPARLLE